MYRAFLNYEELIREDMPYMDLTSVVLGIDSKTAEITYHTRENCIVCGTEEVKELFARLNIETVKMIPSGTEVAPGTELITGRGAAIDIVTAWKIGQNIVDHATGMATRARRMVDIVQAVNPRIAVLTTRKMFPATKQLAIKAVIAGGAHPHRLGASETILVFDQHIELIGGMDVFWEKLPEMKKQCCEKKIIFETGDLELALKLLEAGVDGIQLEKLGPDELCEVAAKIRERFPDRTLLAAGGINESNAAEYARADIDGIVTTSLYTAKPADVGAKIKSVG